MTGKRVENKKEVLKAAQSAWVANKYLALACDQKKYLEIRQLLRPDQLQLKEAYTIMKRVDVSIQDVPSEELPELTNALYHVSGYFKRYFSNAKRREINELIKDNPGEALTELEWQTAIHQINYLLPSRLWPEQRLKEFNRVPSAIDNAGRAYHTHELLWMGDYILIEP